MKPNLPKKQHVLVSFSGGRTSAFMTWWICNQLQGQGYDILVVFANTGEEHEETLKFVNRMDRWLRKDFGVKMVWIEALVNPEEGQGIRHRVVTYRTASRKGEPYEDMCRKYGLPGVSRPFCSKYLKLYPIVSYARSLGWEPGEYAMAIGIRADEIDRMNPNARELKIWYPLIPLEIKKADILTWWSRQAFDLKLREHEGNCKWCWKKSMRKHLTLVKESPEFFDFPRRMEQDYDRVRNKLDQPPKRMFRGKRSVDDLFREAQQPFEMFEEGELDRSEGCTESCEVFPENLGLKELLS